MEPAPVHLFFCFLTTSHLPYCQMMGEQHLSSSGTSGLLKAEKSDCMLQCSAENSKMCGGSISCPTTTNVKDCPNPANYSVIWVTDFAVALGIHSIRLLPPTPSCLGIVGADRHVLTSSSSVSVYILTISVLLLHANFSRAKKALQQSTQEQACYFQPVWKLGSGATPRKRPSVPCWQKEREANLWKVQVCTQHIPGWLTCRSWHRWTPVSGWSIKGDSPLGEDKWHWGWELEVCLDL